MLAGKSRGQELRLPGSCLHMGTLRSLHLLGALRIPQKGDPKQSRRVPPSGRDLWYMGGLHGAKTNKETQCEWPDVKSFAIPIESRALFSHHTGLARHSDYPDHVLEMNDVQKVNVPV